MFGLSIFEVIFLGALALIVIGPKELPVVARTIGRFLNELKRSTSGFTEELKQQARIDLNETFIKPNSVKENKESISNTIQDRSENLSQDTVHEPKESLASEVGQSEDSRVNLKKEKQS